MAAYVIADIKITDPGKFERYKALATAAVKAHRGRFLIRGGRSEAVEGAWKPNRLTVIEFPSWDAARNYVDSTDYGQAREARRGAASVDMIVVEGFC
jgi:uncharacterized protein (DUF1330 family)